MKIVYPMQQGGDGAPCEVASLDAFINILNGLKSGTFPLGRNRLWHGGIHLSKAGDWHASGAVRAMADGEIVAYRLAKQPAKATLESEQGQPREAIDLYTSPSFCLVRHRYEAGEQSKNRCTFYSLYMHIACENSYTSPQAARLVVTGRNVSTYEPVPEMVHPQQFRLKRRVVPQGNQTQPLLAIEGAEVKLATPGASPSNYLNHRDESHPYHLVSYVSDPGSLFYIAASQLQEIFPQKPTWMTPPESKPARYLVPHGSWLRQTASSTNGSYGLPAGSEVEVARDCETVTVNGIQTLFYKARVFKTGDGRVTDSAGQVMTNASKGTIGWLADNRRGNPLPAEPSTPVTFEENAPVVNRSDNPIPVQAGEVIGHWGEHQITKTDANGLEIDPDSKAVHFEVFVTEKDGREDTENRNKKALEDCINNQARLTTGQGYLLLKAGEPVTTHRLTSDNQHSYHDLAQFGPLLLPMAVKESDIISHGANDFVKVRERTAAAGELAGEFVLLVGDTQLVSQHDWGKLGVKLIDGSSDPDGFLDKADTEGKEGGEFFSTLYDKLVTDRDSDGTLSGDDIKAAFADAELAGKLRRLFIKHESEWIQRESWPRLEQELTNKPNLYKYAMQVHKNMAWINDARDILGDTKHWFIHPAGMMGLVGEGTCSQHCSQLAWGEIVDKKLGKAKGCQFRKKVINICAELWGENNQYQYANTLMACMAVETALQFSSSVIRLTPLRNAHGEVELNSTGRPKMVYQPISREIIERDSSISRRNAVGLIQFTAPAVRQINYAHSLSVNKQDLALMDELEQLDYVKLFFTSDKSTLQRMRNPDDIYLYIFCPEAVGKNESYALYSRQKDEEEGINYYRANRSLDSNECGNTGNNDGIIQRSELLARLHMLLDEGKKHIHDCSCTSNAQPTRFIFEPSGAQWVSRYPTSHDINELSPRFYQAAHRFITAIQNAGGNARISATYRPIERAYLMHYAWRIAHEGLDPADVPAKDGVNIDWTHQGDNSAAVAAASNMVLQYRLVYRPSLTSRHIERRAIDMTITNIVGKTMTNGDGHRVLVRNQTVLHIVGASYGVHKLISDPPHWSDDGR